MSAVFGVAALVVLALVANGLRIVTIRFASETSRVTAPTGQPFDVVVHREGVPPYGQTAAFIGVPPRLRLTWAVARHPRGQPWRWEVTVYPRDRVRWPEVFHEVVADRDAARMKASEISQQIEAGVPPWLEDGPDPVAPAPQ